MNKIPSPPFKWQSFACGVTVFSELPKNPKMNPMNVCKLMLMVNKTLNLASWLGQGAVGSDGQEGRRYTPSRLRIETQLPQPKMIPS
jgi:hypothetical protein